MARRIPLPRLTQRQRTARWQRERRQQTVIVIVFTVLLFGALGLVAWAATERYYTDNLKPAATIEGRVIPYRLFSRERAFELVRLYVQYQVPVELENDPRLLQEKSQYDGLALSDLVEQALLDLSARQGAYTVPPADIDARYTADFSQWRSRHILVEPDSSAADKDAADKAALGRAQDIAKQLQASPNDAELWAKLAKDNSADPGSKDKGGELGFTSKGEFVKEYEDALTGMKVGAVSDPVKSAFGYHVIQLEEVRAPEANPLVQRWQSSGFSLADIKIHVRYELLRERVTQQIQDELSRSPSEQLHLLHITVNTPAPGNVAATDFTAALKKLSDVKQALDKGTDFAEVARQFSENPDEAKNGGDAGWFTRGMFDNYQKEKELFALQPGTVSRQFSSKTVTELYKVVEKDPARALADDQKQKLKDNAYVYWLDRERRAHDAVKLVPGLEFGP